MAVFVDNTLTVPDGELDWRFTPSGGPGGQHANRASTRVELRWNIAGSEAVSGDRRRRLLARLGDEVLVVVDDERSQVRNRAIAERRLAERVAAALVVPKARRPTKPTKGAKERRLQSKRQRSRDKELRRRPRRDD